jgi:hypothetical protein
VKKKKKKAVFFGFKKEELRTAQTSAFFVATREE